VPQVLRVLLGAGYLSGAMGATERWVLPGALRKSRPIHGSPMLTVGVAKVHRFW